MRKYVLAAFSLAAATLMVSSCSENSTLSDHTKISPQDIASAINQVANSEHDVVFCKSGDANVVMGKDSFPSLSMEAFAAWKASSTLVSQGKADTSKAAAEKATNENTATMVDCAHKGNLFHGIKNSKDPLQPTPTSFVKEAARHTS